MQQYTKAEDSIQDLTKKRTYRNFLKATLPTLRLEKPHKSPTEYMQIASVRWRALPDYEKMSYCDYPRTPPALSRQCGQFFLVGSAQLLD